MAYGRTGGDFPVALLCVVEPAIRQALAGGAGNAASNADTPIKDLCANPAIVAEVMKSVRQVCKEQGLNDFEVPKKIALLPPVDGAAAWTAENDLLTAALKL